MEFLTLCLSLLAPGRRARRIRYTATKRNEGFELERSLTNRFSRILPAATAKTFAFVWAVAVLQVSPADAWDYTDVSRISCREYVASVGSWRFSALGDPIVEYVGRHGAFEEGSGSACNTMDFVLAECKLHPQIKIGQAITSLYSKKQSGRKLPNIPIYGA